VPQLCVNGRWIAHEAELQPTQRPEPTLDQHVEPGRNPRPFIAATA
jgi:hypothetical protein